MGVDVGLKNAKALPIVAEEEGFWSGDAGSRTRVRTGRQAKLLRV